MNRNTLHQFLQALGFGSGVNRVDFLGITHPSGPRITEKASKSGDLKTVRCEMRVGMNHFHLQQLACSDVSKVL